MDEASRLRENLGVPAKSFAPFSQDIDIKPADRWELLASISGWAMAYNKPLIITTPSTINGGQPDCVLGDILGRRYDTNKKGNPFSKAGDLESASMVVVIRLLHSKSPRNPECLLIVAKDDANVQDKAISNNQIQSACCAVLIERGWVTFLLQKPETGPNPFYRAFVFTYTTEADTFEQAADQILESMGLDETVEFILVNVPQPQEFSSGIHCVCHVMALHNLGHHWLGDLFDTFLMDVRHALLRTVSMAFIKAAQ